MIIPWTGLGEGKIIQMENREKRLDYIVERLKRTSFGSEALREEAAAAITTLRAENAELKAQTPYNSIDGCKGCGRGWGYAPEKSFEDLRARLAKAEARVGELVSVLGDVMDDHCTDEDCSQPTCVQARSLLNAGEAGRS